jgi:predicted Fe-S protein YdhL (DUF1289 family)
MLPSPCRNVCVMHEPSGHCIGCGRTIDEIALWSLLDDDDRRAVWAMLPARLARLPPGAAAAAAKTPER